MYSLVTCLVGIHFIPIRKKRDDHASVKSVFHTDFFLTISHLRLNLKLLL